jgi:CSLREA domain-containing protein
MRKKENNSTRVSALQITFVVALVSTSAVMLAASFTAQALPKITGSLTPTVPALRPGAATAMTFTVTSTADTDGSTCGATCTLRQAINASNANPPPTGMTNLIQFNIPGSGVHIIALASSLPQISQPVIIDGYTQSGASANTLTIGDNAVILIKIDGGAGPNPISPMIQLCGNNMCFNGSRGDNCTIRGLSIVQSVVAGGTIITVDSNNNLFAGNFIGVDTDGQTVGGITLMQIGQAGNTIGGTSPAARNVMAANASGFGLILNDGDNTLVQGNYLGTNAAGTAAIGTAGTGIFVEVGSGVTIGGSTPASGNVINSTNNGVVIEQVNFFFPVSNITVQGNLIGTDATGTVAFHRLNIGIFLGLSSNTTIGGSAPSAGNVVSGSASQGILIQDSPTGLIIQGNKIGTDITGTMPLGNGNCGIRVSESASTTNGTIGGAGAGQGNIIAFNGLNGVSIVSFNNTGWVILGNSIHDNARLGIALSACGANTPTLNDHCDTDAGANDLQNYPLITSASYDSGTVTLSGTLDSVPNTGFRVEFFSNAEGDPSGNGEGQTFLGSTIVTTDGNCSASFGPLSFPVPPGQLFVTATATILDAGGNPIETSEFSAFFPGPPPPMPTGAVSRKTHGSAGTFDIDLPVTGNVGIECRSGGATNDYRMIITFANSVTVENASVTSGTGSVSSFSVSGSQVTVNLTGVTNVQRITVTLHNVNDGMHSGDVPVSMGVLIGDVNGNALVNASDVSLTKSQVGMAVSSSNFREDVNANGLINSVDVALVKSKVGTALPP